MPRHKKHDVWENYLHSATSKSVMCKHCEKVYKFGNVSKMTGHLLKCFKCPPAIKNKLKNLSATSVTRINLPLRDLRQQEQGNRFLENSSTEISVEKKLYLDQLLSKAIFVTDSPMSIVDHPLWAKFFEEVQPLYKMPSRNAISTTHLETTYKDMLKEIAEELKSANDLHLLCEAWCNQRNKGNINIIIAKPEPVFVKSLNTLPNRHTSQYISKEILEVMNMYGSHKFVTLIGDNDDNIQRVFQIVKNTHAQVLPLRCVAHTLNLFCEDCLKPEPIKAFISLAVETIKAVKKSHTLNALLAQIVKDKGLGETLKLPVKTRWGSYCTALKSLKNSKVALQTLAVHEDSTIAAETKSTLLDAIFWSMTENCIKLLEPITDKIIKLEGNGIPINEVYMAFRDIKSKLTNVLPDISILKDKHKEDIINAVIRRTNNCLKPIHCAAYLLDPRSQGVGLDEKHEVDAMEFIHEVGQSLNIDINVDLANYRAKQGLWDRSFIWKNVASMDPVAWWRGLCKSKLLSRVAVRILTTPCSSSATEWSNITHAPIQNQKRNKLATDRAAKIALISYNWNLLHKHKDVNNDDEDELLSSTPGVVLSPITSPMDEEQPSTSCVNMEEIEFCDITVIKPECHYIGSSDSD